MGTRAQHSPSYRRFRTLLRQWRLEAGLTQRELARRLRKPPSYVHKCEAGDRRVDPVEFIAWTRACGQDAARAITQVQAEAR